jgi:hypothetical protein
MCDSLRAGSARSVGESGSDLGAGVQGAQDGDGGDGGTRQLGGYILGDASQPQHIDLERLPRSPRCLKVLPAVVPNPSYSPNQPATNALCIRNQYAHTPPPTGFVVF